MSGSRSLSLAVAIYVAATIWSPPSRGQALDTGPSGTDPWIVVCDRSSCIDSEHALNSFFNVVYEEGLFWTGDYNPYFLATDDWTTLLAISTARRKAVAAHRESRAADLCWRSKTIHTPAQLGAALDDNARTAKELAAAYRTEVDSELSPEGRVIVDQAINRLPDHLHTVNLDHTAYFSAAPIEPASYLELLCNHLTMRQVTGESELPRDDTRLAKPDVLPLAVFVGPECPVSLDLVRESAEAAISRAGIEPLRWPALERTFSWFGVYVDLECNESTSFLGFSLIDSVDGSLELYDGLDRFSDGFHGIGMGAPDVDGRAGPTMTYPSFVSRVVEYHIPLILRAHFDL